MVVLWFPARTPKKDKLCSSMARHLPLASHQEVAVKSQLIKHKQYSMRQALLAQQLATAEFPWNSFRIRIHITTM